MLARALVHEVNPGCCHLSKQRRASALRLQTVRTSLLTSLRVDLKIRIGELLHEL